MTTYNTMFITDLKVSALPGSKVSEAKLNEIRRNLNSGLNLSTGGTTISGKAFFKVTGRDANGTTIVSTVIQSLPNEKPVILRFSQLIAPDGKITNMKVDTENAVLKALFQNLTPEKLEQFANQNGSNFRNTYGQPLLVNQPRTETLTLDAEELLGSVFNAIANEQNAEALFGQVKSTPLTLTTTTTYLGLNNQGTHEFKQNTQYGSWKITLAGKDNLPGIVMELGDVIAKGTQSYRRDGLPGSSTQSIQMLMNMTMTLDGVQVKYTMVIQQTVAMLPR